MTGLSDAGVLGMNVIVCVAALSIALVLVRRRSTLPSKPPPTSTCPPTRTVSFARVVELSHPIYEGMPLWPGDPAVDLVTVATVGHDGFFLRRLTIGEHSGTHMNAPNSFLRGGTDITDTAPAQRVVEAVVVDVSAACAVDRDHRVSRADIEAWEDEHGIVPAGAVVLVRTGWDRKWHDPAAFLNHEVDGMHFPGIDAAAAAWLLDERGVAGLGIDTHGLDAGQDESLATNKALAARGLIALECVAQLHALPARGVTLVLAPLQLRGGSGAPLGLLALVAPDAA